MSHNFMCSSHTMPTSGKPYLKDNFLPHKNHMHLNISGYSVGAVITTFLVWLLWFRPLPFPFGISSFLDFFTAAPKQLWRFELSIRPKAVVTCSKAYFLLEVVMQPLYGPEQDSSYCGNLREAFCLSGHRSILRHCGDSRV